MARIIELSKMVVLLKSELRDSFWYEVPPSSVCGASRGVPFMFHLHILMNHKHEQDYLKNVEPFALRAGIWARIVQTPEDAVSFVCDKTGQRTEGQRVSVDPIS